MWWMLLVLFYGLMKGAREIVKKMALKKSSVMEVLFVYTFLSFVMVVPQYKNAMGLPSNAYFYIALKSFFIFLAWICSFKAIRKMPISLYGILDLSRVLFATLLGVIVLNETLFPLQIAGLVFVSAGLLLLKYRPSFIKNKIGNCDEKNEEKVKWKYVVFAFASCMLNALSGLMDKILMGHMNSSQLQFWYMLFLVSYYFIYLLITRTRIHASAWKNGWIWLLSIMFVAADKALFVANGMPDSRVTVMTLIKQSGCLVTILAGKYIFKEKDIRYKLFCAAIIVVGIMFGVMA